MPKTIDPFDDKGMHLRNLPDSTLRDLGRNGAAPRDYRKLAVEILLVRKSPYANHEDLREFVRELKIELDGIQTEFPAPEPVQVTNYRPLTASVTTQTLYGASDAPIDNTEKDADAAE